MLQSGVATQQSLIARDPHDARLYDYLASSYDEYFVTPVTWERVFKPLGIGMRPSRPSY